MISPYTFPDEAPSAGLIVSKQQIDYLTQLKHAHTHAHTHTRLVLFMNFLVVVFTFYFRSLKLILPQTLQVNYNDLLYYFLFSVFLEQK